MTKEHFSLLASTVLALAQAFSIPAAESESGFKNIFNGKDLSGWEGNPQLWSVKDGAITGATTDEHPLKGNTFLIWTNGVVENFELRCSYRIAPNNDKGFANSGIQYRSKVLDPANWVVGGYQADMEAGSTYSGILYEERMSRGIMAARGERVLWDKECNKKVVGSLGKSEEIQATIKKDDWNEYRIVAQENHLQHFINGKATVDVSDDCEAKRATSGVLALQLHAGQPMTVQFKDLRLKVLGGGGRASPDDLKKLQGTWKAVSGEANGEAMAADDLNGITVIIKDSSYKVLREGEELDHGTFTGDFSKQPSQMDIHPESGGAAGQTMRAICQIDGDNLKVCYARNEGPRPTSFSTADNANHLLLTYKRKTD